MVTRAEQARRTQQGILDTARTLFAEQGFDATSLQQIADRMGVQKANVYYYFRTKEAILSALLAPMVVALDDLVASVAPIADPADRRTAMIDGFVRTAVSAFRSVGSLGLGDPALRRNLDLAAELDDLSARAATMLFGPEPTDDEIASWSVLIDLGPALRRLAHLPDDDLVEVLTALCTRTLPPPKPG